MIATGNEVGLCREYVSLRTTATGLGRGHASESLIEGGKRSGKLRLGLHVILHDTATAEAATAACARGALRRPRNGSAILTRLAGNRKRLLLCTGGRGGRLQRRAADPELHQGQHDRDHTAQSQGQNCGDKGHHTAVRARHQEELHQAIDAVEGNNDRHGEIVVAEVVSPAGNLDDRVENVHFYLGGTNQARGGQPSLNFRLLAFPETLIVQSLGTTAN